MKRKNKNLERAIEILSKQYEGNHKIIMDIVYAEQREGDRHRDVWSSGHDKRLSVQCAVCHVAFVARIGLACPFYLQVRVVARECATSEGDGT